MNKNNDKRWFYRNKIGLMINTKNEEKNITECINSAKSIVDEIIVVDMQSTDRTVELAEKLGAKIYKIKDYGYVEPARNFALNKITMPWTLIIDTDERFTKILLKKIKNIVKEAKYDGYKFPIKNILLGKWIEHGIWWPDYRLRLFKTGHLDWPVQIHKDPVFDGTILNLPPVEENAVVHYNIADIRELLEMIDRYSTYEKVFQSKKMSAGEFVTYFEKEFKWRYFEHQGYLDGMHGFILAKFMNVYRLLEVAKYWERKGYKEMFDSIELKEAVEDHYSQGSYNENYFRDKIEKLEEDLRKIQSSKFYQFWQFYCGIRDNLLKKVNLK